MFSAGTITDIELAVRSSGEVPQPSIHFVALIVATVLGGIEGDLSGRMTTGYRASGLCFVG